MNGRRTGSVAARVLRQLLHDHRTVGLLLVVPPVLMTLLRGVYDGNPRVYQGVAPALLAIFPFTTLFLVTSVAMLRERMAGTLERLLTMPLGRLDLLVGYAIAFSLVALVQTALTSAVTVLFLDVDVAAGIPALLAVALVDALLGVALGLLVSAFANTEFQAVQFLPATVLPQLLLCGLFAPRDQMQPVLAAAARVLPLTYAVSAVRSAASPGAVAADVLPDAAVVLGFALAAVVAAGLTLRRRSA